MRILYSVLIVVFLLTIAGTWMSNVVDIDPRDEALSFLNDVRKGGLAKSVKHFGGNACRCPAKGGWGSYLIYISGQEPNLAFMTGHPFETGKPNRIRIKNDRQQALLPWQKPEDFAIDVPISFDPKQYAPLFLPLPMAYGLSMTQTQLNEFLADPDKDSWKGLTLRLRPSLNPGSIAPPKEPLPKEAKAEFKDLQAPAKDEINTEDAVKQALGVEAAQYIMPKDAAPVAMSDGTVISPVTIEKELPRLKAAVLRLHVVRRGQLNEWTVYHFGLMHPVLVFPDGRELRLTHDRRPGAHESS